VETQIQSTSKRGGKRPGAGRKPGTVEAITLAKQTLAERCFDFVYKRTKQKPEDLWFPLLTSTDDIVRSKALTYMTDRLEGKAKETHEVTATHTIALSEADRLAAQSIIARLKS
jgi:hypothetical protein